jgi:hypothetical protein
VTFEVARAEGPFELCHCSRCRKSSGSAFVATFHAQAASLRFLSGRELVRSFALPVRESPPAYQRFFCGRCGVQVPDPNPAGERVEVPAGCMEGELEIRPDRHIYVEHRASWDDALDELPRLTRAEVRALRAKGQ